MSRIVPHPMDSREAPSAPGSPYNGGMNLFMACPAPRGSRKGNRVTAERWKTILERLGHRVAIGGEYNGSPCDVLIALHARKSYPAIAAYRAAQPTGPLVLCLTGTDVYRDIRTSARAQRSLELADLLVTLQERAADELAPRLRSKVRVVLQSATAVGGKPPKKRSPLEVIVLGHLRAEKDPFRAALALRHIPAIENIRVTHLGQALSPAMAQRAKKLMAREPRYRWLGEIPRLQARRRLASSHVMVISSRMEGGANVISEALVEGVPVIASNIPGNVGLLSADYPALYPVGDAARLAGLLRRTADDDFFYRELAAWCRRRAKAFDPRREVQSWRSLLAELVP